MGQEGQENVDEWLTLHGSEELKEAQTRTSNWTLTVTRIEIRRCLHGQPIVYLR